MYKRGIAVLLLFMAAAFLHAGKHTDLGVKISFDFGERTLEEVSALYDELLDMLGTSYKLEERYEPRRDSYFHWLERWTYIDRSNRLDGQVAAYRDFQKGMLFAIKSFAEERNVKVTGCSSIMMPITSPEASP